MEEIVNIILSHPNDAELGAAIRAAHTQSPELFVESDKYLRLFAEFDNFRKRTNKERADVENRAKMNAVDPLLELYDDLYYSLKNSKGDNTGIQLVYDKLGRKLASVGINEVQTTEYDMNVHEVISTMGTGKKILDVLSKGYSIDGNIYRYPKVVLG